MPEQLEPRVPRAVELTWKPFGEDGLEMAELNGVRAFVEFEDDGTCFAWLTGDIRSDGRTGKSLATRDEAREWCREGIVGHLDWLRRRLEQWKEWL